MRFIDCGKSISTEDGVHEKVNIDFVQKIKHISTACASSSCYTIALLLNPTKKFSDIFTLYVVSKIKLLYISESKCTEIIFSFKI